MTEKYVLRKVIPACSKILTIGQTYSVDSGEYKDYFNIIDDRGMSISLSVNYLESFTKLSQAKEGNISDYPEHLLIDMPIKPITGANDGSKNSFYSLPDWVKDCDDLAEYLELDPYEFNILKTLWLNKGMRHDGTTKSRELNKRKYYAEKCIDKHNRK